MSRRICPELYPDPRPSRLLQPLMPYLPLLTRVLPWLAAAPVVFALALALVHALPVLTWLVLCTAVLVPLAAGVAIFNFGWE